MGILVSLHFLLGSGLKIGHCSFLYQKLRKNLQNRYTDCGLKNQIEHQE